MSGRSNTGALAALVLLCATPLAGQTLDLGEAAVETAAEVRPMASAALPTAGWDGTAVPARQVEGQVTRRAWRLDRPGDGTLEILAPLRAQLQAQGFAILFECEARACGGFDFRFAIEVLPEPQMHVDLGDFRYLAAARGAEAVSLLVSRSAAAGFVQMTHVGPAAAALPAPPAAVATPPDPPPDLIARLTGDGVVALDDLRFDHASTELAGDSFASLNALSEWLAENPARRIALVGHTDAVGTLQANVAISRSRAEAVMAVLVGSYGVDEGQISAWGVSYLSPRASNRTEEGRARNRRVEAVVVADE